MKCRICGESIFEDEAIYGLNPVTFRLAIMHYQCCIVALDDIATDKKPLYIEKAATIPHPAS